MAPLDLERNVVLERFQFNVQLSCISLVPKWIYRTLRTITSPLFKEFSFSVLCAMRMWWHFTVSDGWDDVDMLFNVLSERNPDFRVVFRGNWPYYKGGGSGTIPGFLKSYLPLVSSKGLVKFEHVPDAENQFWKYGFR